MRARWRGPSDGDAAASNRTSTRVFEVLACWPPGPPDPEKRHSSSPIAIVHDRVTRNRPSSIIPARGYGPPRPTRQNGGMSERGARAVALAVLVACMLGACGSSHGSSSSTTGGPNPSGPNPGPNTSTFNPGPNPTSNGPVTIEGTLQVTPQCLTLQRPQGP